MTTRQITPIDALLARAQCRYAAREDTLAALAQSALAQVEGYGDLRESDRAAIAHVALALLAAERLPRSSRRAPLIAERVVGGAEPTEHALAEHLHARLAPEVALVLAVRAACGVSERVAAESLHLTVGELRTIEALAQEDAESLVLHYHDEFICEPADLAGLASSAAVTEAVRQHLGRCRSCRREFTERVWHVLGLAGALSLPLPPRSTPAANRRLRVRQALDRPRTARRRVG